jgi:hypothetical protein
VKPSSTLLSSGPKEALPSSIPPSKKVELRSPTCICATSAAHVLTWPLLYCRVVFGVVHSSEWPDGIEAAFIVIRVKPDERFKRSGELRLINRIRGMINMALDGHHDGHFKFSHPRPPQNPPPELIGYRVSTPTRSAPVSRKDPGSGFARRKAKE